MPAHPVPHAQPDYVKEEHGTRGVRAWGGRRVARAGAPPGRHLYPPKEPYEQFCSQQEETFTMFEMAPRL